VRIASDADSLLVRSPSAVERRVALLRAVPAPVTSLASLFPVAPIGRTPRVGDRITQSDVAVRGLILPGGATDLRCDFSHEVAALETAVVPAGSFESVRIESSARCGGQDRFQMTSWLASEVGTVRLQVRSGSVTSVELALRCWEAPETAGRCAALD
jgi:hypothetical protein